MITITTVGLRRHSCRSRTARLIDAFFVTPVRIFVWFIFIGTAYQLIIQRLLEDWRMTRLQKRPARHVIRLRLRAQRRRSPPPSSCERGWSSRAGHVIDRG
jgi:hypothetical protein